MNKQSFDCTEASHNGEFHKTLGHCFEPDYQLMPNYVENNSKILQTRKLAKTKIQLLMNDEHEQKWQFWNRLKKGNLSGGEKD